MIERYRHTDVTTASPIAIVAKLYEGALRNAVQAREHIGTGCIAERVRSLSKTIAIVNELHGSLDMERGGEIATNLDELYGFVTGRLLMANLESSLEALDEAVQVLETLNEAWQHIARGTEVTGGVSP